MEHCFFRRQLASHLYIKTILSIFRSEKVVESSRTPTVVIVFVRLVTHPYLLYVDQYINTKIYTRHSRKQFVTVCTFTDIPYGAGVVCIRQQQSYIIIGCHDLPRRAVIFRRHLCRQKNENRA
jgi:hypothetical protein